MTTVESVSEKSALFAEYMDLCDQRDSLREQLAPHQSKVDDLSAKLASLDERISEVDHSIYGQLNARRRDLGPMGRRVVDFVEAHDVPVRPRQVAEALGLKVESVTSCLSHLFHEGRVSKPSRGHYTKGHGV